MKKYFLQKAEENLPKIYAEKISISADAKVLHSGDSFVLDLGNHHVGYFSFVLGQGPLKYLSFRLCSLQKFTLALL